MGVLARGHGRYPRSGHRSQAPAQLGGGPPARRRADRRHEGRRDPATASQSRSPVRLRGLALESGVWQSTDGSYAGRRVRIDPERCIEAIEGIARQEESLDRLAAGHRVAELDYEALAMGE